MTSARCGLGLLVVALLLPSLAVAQASGEAAASQRSSAPGASATAAPAPAVVAPARATPPAEKRPYAIELRYGEGFLPYDEGFLLRTHNKTIELKLAASAQLDGRFYEGSSVAPHSFDIRRARIDFSARLFDRVMIRIQGAFEDTPYIRNAFIDVRFWSVLHLRVGQMKVPFSSTWLAFDNQVDFLERPTAEPLYPFFDRGAMIWGDLFGQRITYNFGVFTGAGVDLDANKGDIDNSKDIAWRLFLQPFRGSSHRWLEGIYLAGHGTWGMMSVPTRRYETRGLGTPNFESLVWRWRTEQVLGNNGRNTDQIGAEIDSKTRWGAELHYLYGPFTFSAEWAMVRYDGIKIFHDFYQGSKRLLRQEVLSTDGTIHNVSGFVSYFLTGEQKYLDNFGWRQPLPRRPVFLSPRGIGAFELLARFSATFTSSDLFNSQKVAGYRSGDFTDPNAKLAGAAAGDGASVTAAALEGASKLYEITGGVNWTMNYHLRVQLNYVYLWAPDYAEGKNGIISAGNSELSDTTLKNKIVKSEHMLAFRFIMRI
jgi:phosphate-selective porin